MSRSVQTACRHCSPTDEVPESPFHTTHTLVTEPHCGVQLGTCRHCNAPAMRYWVDIYDDFWSYWCRVSADEAAELQDAAGAVDIDHGECFAIVQAQRLIQQNKVLCKHPVHGLGWMDGDGALLCGPPW